METDYSTTKFSPPYGVLLGLILVVIAVLMYVSGMIEEEKQWPVYVYYFFFPFFIGYSVFEYRKKNGGFLSFKTALKVGVTVALVGGIVYSVYNLIYFYILEPDTVEKILAVTKEKILEQDPNMSEENLAQTMNLTERFAHPLFASAMYLLLSAVFGFFYGLISGAIFKRERPNFI